MVVAVDDVGGDAGTTAAVGATASVLLYPLFWPPLLLSVFTLLLLVVLISGEATRLGVAVGLDPRLDGSADWKEIGPPDTGTGAVILVAEVSVVDVVVVNTAPAVSVIVVVLADMVGL